MSGGESDTPLDHRAALPPTEVSYSSQELSLCLSKVFGIERAQQHLQLSVVATNQLLKWSSMPQSVNATEADSYLGSAREEARFSLLLATLNDNVCDWHIMCRGRRRRSWEHHFLLSEVFHLGTRQEGEGWNCGFTVNIFRE